MPEKTPSLIAPPAVALSAASESPSASTPKKSTFARNLVLVALALVLSGGGAWFFLARGGQTEASGTASDKVAPQVVHLEGFTVNLADAEENHFLRVSMDLALRRVPPPLEHDKPLSGLPMPQMRDSILSVLTVCKSEALLTPEGKETLKKNLRDALNRDNPDLGVQDVYFTEFLVQR